MSISSTQRRREIIVEEVAVNRKGKNRGVDEGNVRDSLMSWIQHVLTLQEFQEGRGLYTAREIYRKRYRKQQEIARG